VAKIDLSKMNLDELKELQKDLPKAIEEFTERRRREALAAAKEAAAAAGFSLEELVGKPSKPKGCFLPAKYRHPENPEVTWSGRGRRPAWIKEALDEGKSLEDFAI
jgi:DNA-binding protein H-NS